MSKRVCNILEIEKPIIQGPLNWLTDAKYVAAVSNAGGLGVIGFNAGIKEPVFTIEETMENIRNEIRRVKELTDKPFGLNIAPTSDDPEVDRFTGPTLEVMKEEKVPVAVMVGELMPGWIKKFHDNHIKVVFRAANPNIENTKEAIKAGVDILVATGFDEGGTVPKKAIGTFSIVPMIVDATEGKVPVMAAGGISDERTAKAAFALGAEGLYVGTAFMMAEESPLAKNIKEEGTKINATDLIMYRTVPAYYRSLKGELPNKLLKMSREGASEEEIYKAQNAYIGMRNGMLMGDLTKGYASFGLGISMINKIEPVSVIMNRLMKGIEE